MLLYKYDKNTKEYVGCLGEALIDPLESKLKGKDIIVIPPCCTPRQPKILQENTVNVFNEEIMDWEVVEDYRGLRGFDSKTKQPMMITGIGPLPTNFVKELPKTLQDIRIEKIKEIKRAYSTIKEELDSKLDFRLNLKRALEGSEFNVLAVEDGDEVLTLNREEAENILKEIGLRELLLPLRKKDLIREVKKLRSSNKIAEFKIDFNINKEVKKLLNKSNEEIEKYVLEESK